ncbi:hypothetical protein H4V96_001549 [Janthinobacterium sp. CG_23.4]|nr:hypothetical protein [Janthinobacterium sp. CG_23.4]
MYKQLNGAYVIRLADNAYVPRDPENQDYQAYLSWLAEGNTPEQEDPPIDGAPAFPPYAEPATP